MGRGGPRMPASRTLLWPALPVLVALATVILGGQNGRMPASKGGLKQLKANKIHTSSPVEVSLASLAVTQQYTMLCLLSAGQAVEPWETFHATIIQVARGALRATQLPINGSLSPPDRSANRNRHAAAVVQVSTSQIITGSLHG